MDDDIDMVDSDGIRGCRQRQIEDRLSYDQALVDDRSDAEAQPICGDDDLSGLDILSVRPASTSDQMGCWPVAVNMVSASPSRSMSTRCFIPCPTISSNTGLTCERERQPPHGRRSRHEYPLWMLTATSLSPAASVRGAPRVRW
jgi:hypothetical protein